MAGLEKSRAEEEVRPEVCPDDSRDDRYYYDDATGYEVYDENSELEDEEAGDA